MNRNFKGVHKDIQEMLLAAESQGFRVEKNPGGHFSVYPKDKSLGFVTVQKSPSDRRGIANVRSLLRKIGVSL